MVQDQSAACKRPLLLSLGPLHPAESQHSGHRHAGTKFSLYRRTITVNFNPSDPSARGWLVRISVLHVQYVSKVMVMSFFSMYEDCLFQAVGRSSLSRSAEMRRFKMEAMARLMIVLIAFILSKVAAHTAWCRVL